MSTKLNDAYISMYQQPKLDESVKEPEAIDEISKETLGKYVNGASKDIEFSSKHRERSHRGFEDSAKHDNESLTNIYKDDKKYYTNRLDKRLSGIGKAIGKLTKEQFEAFEAYMAEDKLILDELLSLTEITEESMTGCIKKVADNYTLKKMNIPYGELKNQAAAIKMSTDKLKTLANTSQKQSNEAYEDLGAISKEIGKAKNTLLAKQPKAQKDPNIENMKKDPNVVAEQAAINKLKQLTISTQKLTMEDKEYIFDILNDLENNLI